MAIILDVIVDPGSGESYDIVTVENIAEGYIVHIYPPNYNIEFGYSLQGEKFLYYGAQTAAALTPGVQRLIDDGKLLVIV